MKNIIIDLDNTISFKSDCSSYMLAEPDLKIIKKLDQYKELGFRIIIFSSRNMRTYEGNIEKINKFTLPAAVEWLEKYNVPYDEIIMGKPWCGHEGFYVDDKSIRPSEFKELSLDKINKLINT